MGDLVPYFDPQLEVPADKIPDALVSPSRNYVTVVANMHWELGGDSGITKYSFAAGSLKFEADFAGDIRLKLSNTVLLCLRGAQFIWRPSSKPPKLPFKLVFPDGVMLKVGEEIIDTFQEVPPSPVVPSWFASQPPREPSPSPPRTPSEPEGTPTPPRRKLGKRLRSPPQVERERVPLAIRGTQDIKPIVSSPTSRSPVRPVVPENPVNENQLPKKRPRSSTPEPLPNHPQRDTASGSGSSRVSALVQVEAPAKEDTSILRPKKKRRRKGGKSSANQPAAEQNRNPALDMVAGFHSHLIGTFPPLADVGRRAGKISVAGVVRGITIPRVSRNGDWTVTTELLDPSNTEQPFTVTMFLPSSLQGCLPNVKMGDILILIKITVVLFQGKPRATGYGDSFQWAGYSLSEKRHFHSTHRTFLDEEHCPFFIPTQDELRYAGQLAEWWMATQELAKSKAGGSDGLMPGPRGRQLITLAEAQPGIFFKAIVEILYKVSLSDQFAEFLITDYTVHPQFLPRQPQEGKPEKQDQVGVYGKRVLKITLWGDTQLEHAREIDPGYYYIDNLRVKFDSKGYLEGTLQDDRRKIDKLRKDDPVLEDLLNRKNKYLSEPASPTMDASKVPRRDYNLHSAGDLLPAPAMPPPRPAQPKKQGPALTRLLYENVVQTPMQKLLGHPSCPEIFRIRARIIAFEPYNLANFTYGYCTNCNTDFMLGSRACHQCEDFDGQYVAYEYRIRLCVEEESNNPAPGSQEHRLSIVVDLSGKDAEMFFSGIPPADLHEVKNARALRSRLVPILGNLEVYQCDLARGDSGKALVYGQYFDMLVQSYKAAVKGENSLGNKRYKIWGTELLPKAPN